MQYSKIAILSSIYLIFFVYIYDVVLCSLVTQGHAITAFFQYLLHQLWTCLKCSSIFRYESFEKTQTIYELTQHVIPQLVEFIPETSIFLMNQLIFACWHRRKSVDLSMYSQNIRCVLILSDRYQTLHPTVWYQRKKKKISRAHF